MPRVSILSTHFPPEPTGNAPYAGALAEGLARRGFEVRVLAAHPHYPERAFLKGFGQWTKRDVVSNVKILRMRHWLPATQSPTTRLLSELSFGVRLLFARWGSPDVIVLVSPALFSTVVAMVRARLTRGRPRVIVWVQDLYSLGVAETQTGGSSTAAVMKTVEGTVLRLADTVVVIHDRFGMYIERALSVNHDRIATVRNWTHLRPSNDDRALDGTRARRHDLGWRDDVTVVLHAGNMGAKQGLENVVDAARLADEQQLPLLFVLLGDGNQCATIKASARDIERIIFLPPAGDEAFQANLRAADILLVNEKPGVSEMSVPSKLTSYFDAERPVVAATDPTGVTADEIRASGGGIVVKAGEPQRLVDACVDLRLSPKRRATLASSGLRYRTDVLGEEAAIDSFVEVIARS